MGSTYPVTDGSVITAAGVNALAFSLIGSDAGGTSTNTSYVQLGSSISIPANTVEDHILIIVDYRTTIGFTYSGGEDVSMKIVIDSTDKKEWDPVQSAGFSISGHSGNMNVSQCGTLFYHYTPSSGEKTAGFDVKIYGKVSTTDGANNQMIATDIYVYGG